MPRSQALTQTLHVHLTADDRKRSPYYLLPFDVPDQIVQLTLHYQFTDALASDKVGREAGNIIDLGLFDPRGYAFLTAQGFRGWSGTAKDRITIGPAEATPGYLPGPIYPGTWHAILGLYQLAPDGCGVTVEVTMMPGSYPLLQPAPNKLGTLDSCDAPGWYRGDLHCHTHHSDATAGVETVAAVARAQGLDFVAVTEHNTVSHLPELVHHSGQATQVATTNGPERARHSGQATQVATTNRPDLLLIPGVEITTYRGHANVWGVRTWQEFRAVTEEHMRLIRAHAREQGLLFSINHPKPGGPAWEFETVMDADAVEGWQALWWVSNHLSLAFWDRLLRQGQRPTLVGGSDKHQRPFDGTPGIYEIGTPTTWVYAGKLSEPGILEGIRAGHVFVSQDPRGPRLSFTARGAGQTAMMGDELRVRLGTTVSFSCCVQANPGPDNHGQDAGQGQLLRAIHKEGEAFRVPLQGAEDAHTWQVTVDEDDYWRVEVIAPPQVPLDQEPAALHVFVLSNPIYVRMETG